MSDEKIAELARRVERAEERAAEIADLGRRVERAEERAAEAEAFATCLARRVGQLDNVLGELHPIGREGEAVPPHGGDYAVGGCGPDGAEPELGSVGSGRSGARTELRQGPEFGGGGSGSGGG